jgi:hypothetical protein
MRSAKAEVESMLKVLPEDCSLEDVQYHLYVLEKVAVGLDRAEAEGTLTQEEVAERMSKWLSE